MIFVAYNNDGDVIATGSSALECILYIEEHEVGHDGHDIAWIESELCLTN